MSKRFAQAVLDRRKQLKLTQEELAKRVGTTKQMVSKYELGQRSPKVAMANAFAEALETTLDELLGIESDETATVNNGSHQPQTIEAQIVSGGMDQLPKEDREQILNVVRAMFANKPNLFKERN